MEVEGPYASNLNKQPSGSLNFRGETFPKISSFLKFFSTLAKGRLTGQIQEHFEGKFSPGLLFLPAISYFTVKIARKILILHLSNNWSTAKKNRLTCKTPLSLR